MKRAFVEVSCDECGQADHYRGKSIDIQAQRKGWIVIRSKHFCDQDCLDKYKLKQPLS